MQLTPTTERERSWVRQTRRSLAQQAVGYILKWGAYGHLPKHIAIIMDGNRRFARKNNLELMNGHSKGFDKMAEVIEWCLDAGIRVLTVYAFSIENFKRSPHEVSYLMDLARDRFRAMQAERPRLERVGVRVRFVGNLALLPADIRAMCSEIELAEPPADAPAERLLLQMAVSYTTSDELATALGELHAAVRDGRLLQSDVNAELLERAFYTPADPPPELVIRTSGETRLSDFLVWQAARAGAELEFVDAYWPEFSAWHFYSALFHFLFRHNPSLASDQKKSSSANTSSSEEASHVERVDRFLSQLKADRLELLRKELPSKS